MAITDNYGMIKPLKSTTGWHDEIWRNTDMADAFFLQFANKYFTVQGGEVVKENNVTLSVSDTITRVGEIQQSYEQTIFEFKDDGDLNYPQLNDNSDHTYRTYYIYVQTFQNSAPRPYYDEGILCKDHVPEFDCVLLAIVDVDNTQIVRVIDARTYEQNNTDINPGFSLLNEETDSIVKTLVCSVRNDSDGGEWIKNCQNASWRNEELGTSTRGVKKDFPHDFAIVATEDKIAIYDCASSLPQMWYVFNGNASEQYAVFATAGSIPISDIAYKNGKLFITSSGPVGALSIIDFANDITEVRTHLQHRYYSRCVSRSNITVNTAENNYFSSTLHSRDLRGVDAIVLDDSPLDDNGLAQVTVAIACENAVSIINPPGRMGADFEESIIDITGMSDVNSVEFLPHDRLAFVYGDRYYNTGRISTLTVDIAINSWREKYYDFQTTPALLSNSSNLLGIHENNYIGTENGLTILHEMPEEPEEGMVCHVTNEYNTGWLAGDCKSCFCCDVNSETIGIDTTSQHLSETNGIMHLNNWNSANDAVVSNPDSDTLRVAGNGSTTNSYVHQQINNLDTSIVYEFEINAVGDSSDTAEIRLGTTQGGNEILSETTQPPLTPGTTFKHTFKPTQTTIYARFGCSEADGAHDWSVASITAIDNQIENGNFDSDRVWNDQDGGSTGGTINIANNKLTITQGTNSVYMGSENTFPVVEGEVFIIRQKISTTDTSVAIRINMNLDSWDSGSTADTLQEDFVISNETVHKEFKFTADSTGTMHLGLIQGGAVGESVDFENCRIYKVIELDRIDSNNPELVRIAGQITKNEVNSGSQLVSYSGFSEKNYIERVLADASDFIPSNAECFISFWARRPSTNPSDYEMIMDWRDEEGNDYIQVYFAPSGSLNINATGISAIGGNSDSATNEWNHLLIDFNNSGSAFLYINGKLVAEQASSISTLDQSAHLLRIGRSVFSNVYPYNGEIALVKLSHGKIDKRQVLKIYEDEAKFFNNAATVSLFGISEDVKDISYNYDNKLVYVATDEIITEFDMLVSGNGLHGYGENVLDKCSIVLDTNTIRVAQNKFKIPTHLTNNQVQITAPDLKNYWLLIINYGSEQINYSYAAMNNPVDPGEVAFIFLGANSDRVCVIDTPLGVEESYAKFQIEIGRELFNVKYDLNNVSASEETRLIGATNGQSIIHRDKYSVMEKINKLNNKLIASTVKTRMKNYTSLQYLYYGEGYYPIAVYDTNGQKIFEDNYSILWDGFQWFVDTGSSANYYVDWQRTIK